MTDREIDTGGWLERVLAAHLKSRDVARVIYGTVVGLALVVALQGHPPPVGQAIAAIAATAVAMGLAEVYSDVVGEEARTRRHIRLAQVRIAAGDAGAVMLGAGFPMVFFILAAASVFEVEFAYTLSKWTGLGLLCAYGYLAARLAGSRFGGALLHAAAVGAVGGAVIGLKAIVH
jgi:hypothetical protein